ncbi:hypothetical protein [Nocardioides bruguierae]|uniref:Uncharacterized protein n=1 Tax=Nocardioides bruguierae TaxID=2945102 RepID=A0A9X2D9J6_9ACTN|nr:hypothetical protein [Nocardioides bruguierae]MCM0621792.1 hypothetical protein [Nocardioides bruguierae]
MNARTLAWLGGALLLIGVLLLAWPDSSTSPTQTSGTSPSSSPSVTLPTVPPSSTDDLAHDHAHPDLAPQLSVVRAFAKAFTADGPQQQWISGLQAYVTPDLLDGLRYTDPRLRPTGKVVKAAHLAPAEFFKIEIRGGQSLTCTVVAASGGEWVVDSFEPIETLLPSGTDV